MNLFRAVTQFCAYVVATPSSIPGTGGSNKIGFDSVTEEFSTADAAYFTQIAGITDSLNPTVVLATGVCTANGTTITGSDGEDLYNVAIPSISLGYFLGIKRTDSNGGTLAIVGGTTGTTLKLAAGEKAALWVSAPITTDTLTFDNSTSAAATVQLFVLGRDAA